MKHIAILLTGLGSSALAQEPAVTKLSSNPSVGLGFTLGLGAQSAPAYFGSNESAVGATGSFDFGYLTLPPLAFGGEDKDGLGFKGGFRYIGARSSDDYGELTGLEDVDAALELGGGITFADTTNGNQDNWGSYSFAEVRYGAIGHNAWVAEIGSDLIYAPNPDLTLTLGPRLFGGSDDYSATYFGITDDEAAASAFPAYTAGGGVLSRGVEASASYDVNAVWGIVGTVTYEEFLNDAASSPIVQQGSADQVSASIVLTRAFSF